MIAIIDYRAGNLTSVRLAFEALKADAVITDDPRVIRSADRVVFPGVGAAGTAMHNLRQLGLEQPIRDTIAAGTPFLGICVGTQLMLEHSEEDGGVDALGIVEGRVQRFTPSNPQDKVPQMGWNQATFTRPHPLCDGIADNSDFYFVHSYYPNPAIPSDIVATTTYADVTFASMVGRKNLAATQFHPEKSGRIGLKLLQNFIAWNGKA